MNDVDEIVAVLNHHQQSARSQRCICGWGGDVSQGVTSPNNIYQQHRQHIAETLIAAGFTRNP